MGVHSELRDAIENSRADVIATLAKHKVLPVEVDETSGQETANLLGSSRKPEFQFEHYDEDAGEDDHVLDRQTRKLALDKIGVETVDDCEDVIEEIKNHDDWGKAA